MLGTALLAKATDLRIDPFALKSGLATPGAYSARSLCQHVLAANAIRLGIDLGVTGREPLNNQPFFAEDRVHEGLPVHNKAVTGFRILLNALAVAARMSSEDEARGALRAFLRERVEQRYKGDLALRAEKGYTSNDIISAIGTFVSTKSEYGRRAQAAAAGLLESLSPNAVQVSHVHDPDRHFPGDVNINSDGLIVQTFEVRDKAVNGPDAYHFIEKVAQSSIRSAAIVAVGPTQVQLDELALVKFAAGRGVVLQLFYTWGALANAASFWCTRSPDWRDAIAAIHRRALELEVSEDGIRQWEALAKERV
jgi:hypothetical protein